MKFVFSQAQADGLGLLGSDGVGGQSDTVGQSDIVYQALLMCFARQGCLGVPGLKVWGRVLGGASLGAGHSPEPGPAFSPGSPHALPWQQRAEAYSSFCAPGSPELQ